MNLLRLSGCRKQEHLLGSFSLLLTSRNAGKVETSEGDFQELLDQGFAGLQFPKVSAGSLYSLLAKWNSLWTEIRHPSSVPCFPHPRGGNRASKFQVAGSMPHPAAKHLGQMASIPTSGQTQ